MTTDAKLSLARLTFLQSKYQLKIPRKVVRYLPGGEWLAKLEEGAGSTGVMMDQLQKLILDGETLGPGSPAEAISIIQTMVDRELDESNVTIPEKIEVYTALGRMHDAGLFEEQTVELSKPTKVDVVKWKSGFTPIDIVTDGLYQALMGIMGPPGTGKTSVMMTMAGELRANNACGSILFVENEIPATMMTYRFGPIFDRVAFNERDKLICGPWTADDILEYIIENPDPERVIFYDSPDVVVGGAEDSRRFYLEAAYQTLIKVKQKCKLLVVSSQPRRKDRVMNLRSFAEAWAKAWYIEIALGLNKDGQKLNINCFKNRFGPNERSVTFPYNYIDLSWDAEGLENEEDYW